MAKEVPAPTEPTEAEEDAAFAEGASTLDETAPAAEPTAPAAEAQPPAKPAEPAAVKPAEPAAPKYVQITQEQFDNLTKAAEKTTSFESQFSKVFGTLGDVQKIVKTLQASTPKGTKVEIPKDAFAELAKNFPELSTQIQTGLEATLKGMTGTGSASAEVDPAKFKELVTAEVIKNEIEALEDVYPDWRKIVGAVDTTKNEKPDPTNAFRKWLSGKDAAYQTKINGTNSATIIARAIDLFKKETVARPAPTPPATKPGKAARIKAAVQPRGDGQPPAQKPQEDEFEAGFKSG